MRIIYMGTPDFAVAPLEAIIKAGHDVAAVVTQPDKQKGRGKEVQMTPVKQCALTHQIPVLQPVKIKEADSVEALRAYEADIFVVAAFGQLLTEEILNMPKYGCINIHASLLPAYRGAAPIQWVILNGEEKTGVTIQQMAKGLDTGDMLLKKEVMIDKKETGESLHDKLMEVGAELIVEVLPMIEKGEVCPEKQEEALANYVSRLSKDMGKIDFSKDAVVIERLIRGLNSWPSAFTRYKGKTLKIWDADVTDKETDVLPGTVIDVTKDTIEVAAGKGTLILNSVQLEGKKRVAVKDFLLGYEVKEGMILGGEA